MNLVEKKKIIEDLNARFLKSEIVIVTDYKGLDVMTINELRGKLKESEIDYKVAKNTLLIKASEKTEVALLKDYFIGPNGIAFGYNDPVIPAKVLMKFAKEHDETLTIKAAVMGGKVLDLSAIKKLSALPSRDMLLGQLLALLNGVPTAFVRIMNEIPRSFLNVLQAIKEQKEKAPNN